MHRLKNSVFVTALILASVSALGSRARADELTWNNTAANNRWQTSGSNWWLASATAAVSFGQGDAVVFSDDAPNPAARPGIIVISETGGVTLGASGTNPGMIVTGTGNWEFRFSATSSGTNAAPNIGITDAGSGASAGVLMQGTGILTFSTTTGYTGATNVTAGTLRLNVANAIAQSSAVNIASGATLDLAGNNQTLLALGLASGANVVFGAASATNYARLALGSLTGDGGAGATFNMRTNLAAGAGDQIAITGSASGAYTLIFTNTGGAPAQTFTSLKVVDISSPQNSTATFNGTAEAGARTYNMEQDANGSWILANGNSFSRAADAAIHTAAFAGQDWLYGLDTLYKRMGDLREPPYGGDDAAGAQGGAGNLWLRANASRLNADGSSSGADTLGGYAFHEYAYGAALGADKCFVLGDTMLLFAGLFGDLQYVSRSFNNNGTGNTNALGGGIYLTWAHADGWYADLIGRIDRNKNKFTAIATDGSQTSANYNANVQGFSLEFGRLINWPSDWWIEPAVQYAAANIGGADYTTTGANAFGVHAGSTRASQTRLQFRFGQSDGDNPGWHPYAKLAVVYASANGGDVYADGYADANGRPISIAANNDGWRWEVGFGAAYVLNSRSQFYYDYEYAHATHYNRPWTLNAGYRLMW